MGINLPAFTPMEDSLFLTLCARALDNRSPRPILADVTADEIVRALDYDYGQFHLNKNLVITVALRAKKLDEVASGFLARYPDAVGLDLGAGLDTRMARIAPPPTADWYDIDFPEVITARQQLVPDRTNAHGVGADLTDPDWLDAIPAGRPAVIVADGLMAFLTQDDMIALLNRLISHFPAEKSPSMATPGSPSGRPSTPTAPGPSPTWSNRPASTTPRARTLEPQPETGQGNPAHPRTRGRRVPADAAPVQPARSAQHSLVPEGNHRPALPLLKSEHA